MPDTEAVKKTIIGVCEEIIDKPDNDWVRFNISIGTQYPIGLSTKLPAMIEQARAIGSQTATWTYKESQGKENPNKPGTFFQNRYLEAVEAGEQKPVTAGGNTPAPTRATEGQHAPLPIGDRERSIVRQACLKAAAAVYTGLGTANPPAREDGLLPEDPTVVAVIAAASRFEIWVYRDIDGVPF